MGRRFFFAWIFVVNAAIYGILMVASGHLWRNLLPSGPDLRHIGRSLWDHLRLRFPRGEDAKHYNVLQKLAYLIVVLALGPFMILAGLAMSPRLDASYPFLLDIFDGRQSAPNDPLHIRLFSPGIHGDSHRDGRPLSLRSMVTGWYDLGGGHRNA